MFKSKSLALILMLVLVVSLIGCGGNNQSTTADKVAITEIEENTQNKIDNSVNQAESTNRVPVKSGKYGEAPMLHAKVEAGELPPVDERLPKNPMVVQVEDEIGKYGGTINLPGFAADNLGVPGHVLTETPIMFGPDMDNIEMVGNFIDEWKFSNEGKTLTMHIREGVRWSDGELLTVEDFLFWWEDVIHNKQIVPFIGAYLKPGGEEMKVIAHDDYTLEFNFAIPYYGFIDELNSYWYRGVDIFQPKHYLKKYHIKYNPDVKELAKKEGFEDWVQLFQEHESFGFSNPKPVGRPVLSAWVVIQKTSTGEIYERNPYYFKVDPAGNQLPYIDKIKVIYTPDGETRRLKVLAGNIDYLSSFLSLEDYPTLKANEESGNYDAWIGGDIWASKVTFLIQQDPQSGDPGMAEILSDKRFRQALSLGLNREEINELVFLGQGTPTQLTFSPATALVFKEEWAQAYADYDPERAKALLDEMGLVDQDGDGWRDKPNGERMIVNLLSNSGRGVHVSVAELAESYWKNLGIRINHRSVDEATANQQIWNGEVHIATSIMTGSRPPWDQFNPSAATQFRNGLWFDYFDAYLGELTQEIPENVDAVKPSQDIIDWFTWGRMLLHVGEEEQKELYIKIGDKMAEEILSIGTVRAPGHVSISNKGLGNVRKVGDNPSVAATRAALMEQFYWKDIARRAD